MRSPSGLPRRLAPNELPNAAWFNRLLDWLVANRLQSTPSVRVSALRGGGGIGAYAARGGGGAAGSLPFSGVVWVFGKKYTPTQSSPSQTWLKVDVANGTVTYDATGPANESQFEDGVEWYRVAQLSGDLHVTGF